MTDTETLDIPLRGVELVQLAETRRFRDLDRLESYYRCTQDDGKQYDWDGRFLGYGVEADIAPGWFVPYKKRKPSSRYDLAKVIVNRLTSFIFGGDRFPEIRVLGDSDAEDYAKALCAAARLPARMAEARNLGGSTGTVCLSWGFIDGRPKVEVHNAKHCTVLRWADQSEWKVSAAIKCFMFPRQVFEGGKVKLKDFFFARYWDENVEIVWEPMPREVASSSRWTEWKHRVIRHDCGSAPFYWVQNIPDSQDPDGECDYEGLCDTLDEINQLLSATGRGTKANVDPTLVLKMDPAYNDGAIKRGSDNVIWSPNGAEYLELRGTSTEVALRLVERLRAFALDTASVVLADAEKLSGAAQSAQALRILYAPMLAKCDVLREQYTEFAIRPILVDMLRFARKMQSSSEVVVTEDGEEAVVQRQVVLPPRVIEEEDTVRIEARVPGTSEDLTFNWLPYFSPTWRDIKEASEAVKSANGAKPFISQRSSIAAVQSLFGIDDVEQELHELHEEAEQAVSLAQKSFGVGAPMPVLAHEEEDEEEELEEAEDEGSEESEVE